MEQPFDSGGIRGVLHQPGNPAGDAIALTHGAGSNCQAPLLVRLARTFADAGLLVLRYDLPFRQQRPKGPPFPAAADGFIARLQCEQIGLASLVLGGGRNKQDDVIDHAAGLEFHKKTGDAVKAGESIATVHYNDPARLPEAMRILREACHSAAKPPGDERVLVKKIIEGGSNAFSSS